MKEVLGVHISDVEKQKAVSLILDFLQSDKAHYIFTPNPEMIVEAQSDTEFKQILNQGDLNICDGAGLSFFANTPRITGVDFMIDICHIAEKENKCIYLLGSSDKDVLEKTSSFLKEKFPNLHVAGFDPGYSIQIKKTGESSALVYDPLEHDETVNRIIMSAPDILFVAFGHNKQERWILEHVPYFPTVKIAMGVGGAFDFLSGKSRRAPKMLQHAGLEWLWRLFNEPWRLKRIVNAVIVFPFLVITKKFTYKNIQ